MPQIAVHVEYPAWVHETVDWERAYTSDDERMRLAIAVSLENVERETGGPFGAAIFETASGKLVAVGMNSVVRLNNCTLHGEMVAFMMAQQRLGSFTLAAPGMPTHELFTSCEPCAMCLGATLWSGVRRVVYGAGREDASRLNFEEGRCSRRRTSIWKIAASPSFATCCAPRRARCSSATERRAGRSTTDDD